MTMEALEAFRQGLHDENDSDEDTEIDNLSEEGQISEEEEPSSAEDLTDSEDEDLPKKSTEKKDNSRPKMLLEQSEAYAKCTRKRIEASQDLTDVKNVYLQQRLQSTAVSMDEYKRGKEISKAFFKHNSKYVDESSKSKSIWTQGAEEILR